DKATESVFGTGRIATTAEVTAGTNDQAWVTPAKLAAGFFSKTQLQTSGQAQVHWDNITNVPGGLGAQTLSLGSLAGTVSISGGNSIDLYSLRRKANDDYNSDPVTQGIYVAASPTGVNLPAGGGNYVKFATGTASSSFGIYMPS